MKIAKELDEDFQCCPSYLLVTFFDFEEKFTHRNTRRELILVEYRILHGMQNQEMIKIFSNLSNADVKSLRKTHPHMNTKIQKDTHGALSSCQF